MNYPERVQLEKVVAAMAIGLNRAIADGAISIDEAERLLYLPGVMMLLKELGMDDDVISVVHAGTELEDIQSLIPEQLPESLSRIDQEALRILRNGERIDVNVDHWLGLFRRK